MQKIVGQFIVQILAALGLASLFEKTINWAPIIQKAIDVYREVIYPIWEFLFGWLGIELLDFYKDGFTLNILLMMALSSSKSLGGGRIILFFEIWKQLLKMVSNMRSACSFSNLIGVVDRVANFIWSLASAAASIWLMIMVITISFLIYTGILFVFLWKVLCVENERKEYTSKLTSLLSSTIKVLYGFIALLAINVAVLGGG
ncbi:MAG: hypothetical protein L3J84_13220 [Gammaproteobacteria bacterium]|nr:hypothetical protein [Gammaproteobacteria bacterium]